MFSNATDRGNAEVILRDGILRGNWQAAGLALVVDRLDMILDELETHSPEARGEVGA